LSERLNRRGRMAQHAARASTNLHSTIFFKVQTGFTNVIFFFFFIEVSGFKNGIVDDCVYIYGLCADAPQNRTMETEAFVVGIRKNTVNVLVPRFGLEGPLFLGAEKQGAISLVYDPSTPSLTMKGPKEVRPIVHHYVKALLFIWLFVHTHTHMYMYIFAC
jgi:hypothetical protein